MANGKISFAMYFKYITPSQAHWKLHISLIYLQYLLYTRAYTSAECRVWCGYNFSFKYRDSKIVFFAVPRCRQCFSTVVSVLKFYYFFLYYLMCINCTDHIQGYKEKKLYFPTTDANSRNKVFICVIRFSNCLFQLEMGII